MNQIQSDIINHIIDVEGGYSNRSDDAGGETRYGITEAVARDNGYRGAMAGLPKTFAFDVYSKMYWDKVQADDLLIFSEALAREVVDTGVNCGTHAASEFLQISLNVFNRQEKLYNDIKVDGGIGGKTLRALQAYCEHRDVEILVRTLNCLQGARYVKLALRRQTDEENVYGWIKNRVKVET